MHANPYEDSHSLHIKIPILTLFSERWCCQTANCYLDFALESTFKCGYYMLIKAACNARCKGPAGISIPHPHSMYSMASFVASSQHGQSVHWLLIWDVKPKLRRHLLCADLGPARITGHANCPAPVVCILVSCRSRQPSTYQSVLANMFSFSGCLLDVFSFYDICRLAYCLGRIVAKTGFKCNFHAVGTSTCTPQTANSRICLCSQIFLWLYCGLWNTCNFLKAMSSTLILHCWV